MRFATKGLQNQISVGILFLRLWLSNEDFIIKCAVMVAIDPTASKKESKEWGMYA